MALNSNAYPNGFGESTGDTLVTVSPWYTGAFVRYVSSVLGSDSNSGLEKKLPMATIGAAYTASAVNDIIILASDHDETLTAQLSIAKTGLVIVGAGSSSGAPTAQLRINTASTDLLAVAATDVEIRNIKFPTAVQSNSGFKVSLGSGESTAGFALIKGCRFECALNDQGAGVDLAASDETTIEDCTFVVTETTAGNSPADGMTITDVAVANVVISDCVFDGGTVGFTSGYGMDASASTITGLTIEGASLLNGADMALKAANTGRVNILTSTGSARVIFS